MYYVSHCWLWCFNQWYWYNDTSIKFEMCQYNTINGRFSVYDDSIKLSFNSFSNAVPNCIYVYIYIYTFFCSVCPIGFMSLSCKLSPSLSCFPHGQCKKTVFIITKRNKQKQNLIKAKLFLQLLLLLLLIANEMNIIWLNNKSVGQKIIASNLCYALLLNPN